MTEEDFSALGLNEALHACGCEVADANVVRPMLFSAIERIDWERHRWSAALVESSAMIELVTLLGFRKIYSLLGPREKSSFLLALPKIHHFSGSGFGISLFLSFFLGVKVEILPFAFSVVNARALEPSKLGRTSMRLGVDAVLCGSVIDSSSKVVLKVGLLGRDQIDSLNQGAWILKKGPQHVDPSPKLTLLSSVVLPFFLSVEWCFEFAPPNVQDNWRLGLSALGVRTKMTGSPPGD